MKSMTGYGAGDALSSGTEISVVVKAVNGRFLESRFHLPKEYFQFESQLKKALSETVRRGTFDIFVHRRGSPNLTVNVNRQVAQKWLAAHRTLSQSLQLKTDNQNLLERVSALPQVFDIRDRGPVHTKEKSALIKAFRAALTTCENERRREGLSLKKHLKKILFELQKTVKKMQGLRQEANRELEIRLQEKMRRLGFEGAVEPARFAQELVIHLDKNDISEEIERLREHVLMCEKFLRSSEEQGKKLDFYSQELLREVNTIGSKANYAPLTESVVAAKGLIEAFKEQVQNIE